MSKYIEMLKKEKETFKRKFEEADEDRKALQITTREQSIEILKLQEQVRLLTRRQCRNNHMCKSFETLAAGMISSLVAITDEK